MRSMRDGSLSVCLGTSKSTLHQSKIYKRLSMINKEESVFVEQASEVYRKMSLLELLSEENMLQSYKQKYKERITDELHFVLGQEIAKKLV